MLQDRSNDVDLAMEWMAKYAMLLADSAKIIKYELKFFEDVSKRYDLGLDLASREDIADQNAKAGEITRAYVEMIEGIGSVEEGAVLLWGMEKVSHIFIQSSCEGNENLMSLVLSGLMVLRIADFSCRRGGVQDFG